MTVLTELREMKDALNEHWDSLNAELTELTAISEADMTPELEERLTEVNDDLGGVAEWIEATEASIRSKEISTCSK